MKHVLTIMALLLSATILTSCNHQNATPLAKTDTNIQANAPIETPITTPTEKAVKATETSAPTPTPTTKGYTATEVATHGNATSCWLILDAKVYDVTTFIGKHPGGEAILKGCGKDATQMFSRHPESAKALKEQFYIGDLKS